MVSIAGPLRYFYKNLCSITQNRRVLGWIKDYKIPFSSSPFKQRPVQVYKKSLIKGMSSEIQKLIKKGVVTSCNLTKNQFISPIFLIKKPNGEKRFILNLKCLNKFIQIEHFKWKMLARPWPFYKKIGIWLRLISKTPILLFLLKKSYRKYLKFIYNKKCYMFTALPFGISTGPFVFTKIMREVLKHLRQNNILCVGYLDDILLIAKSKNECSKC